VEPGLPVVRCTVGKEQDVDLVALKLISHEDPRFEGARRAHHDLEVTVAADESGTRATEITMVVEIEFEMIGVRQPVEGERAVRVVRDRRLAGVVPSRRIVVLIRPFLWCVEGEIDVRDRPPRFVDDPTGGEDGQGGDSDVADLVTTRRQRAAQLDSGTAGR